MFLLKFITSNRKYIEENISRKLPDEYAEAISAD